MNGAFQLNDKAALVTGAGMGGIGGAIAIALAEAGADVALTELANRMVEAEETAGRVRATGRRTVVVPLDQTELAQIKGAVEMAVSGLGHLDVLVNNAATALVKPAIDIAEEDWDRVLDTNLKGALFCAQEAAKQMILQGTGGSIVNVASILGFGAYPDRAAYCAAKAGLVNLTRVLAIEWAKHSINVNGVAPGYVMTHPVVTAIDNNPSSVEEIIARIPVRRMGTPEEMALAVVYLASPAASYVTGHTLLIDGGWTAW